MLSKFNRVQLAIFAGIAIFALFVLLSFLGTLPGLQKPPVIRAELEMWGFADESLWKDFLLNKKSPAIEEITVKYKEIPEEQYETTLINALAEGKGPDIFMLKDSQLLKHKNKIEPLKSGTIQNELAITPDNFKNIFVDAVHEGLLTQDGQIFGLPLYLDTLALFYNKDLFNTANIPNPPDNWNEFTAYAEKITKISPLGDILSSGAALGESSNIESFVDIISALIFQSGGGIIDYEKPESIIYRAVTETQDDGTIKSVIPSDKALAFYTSFADTQKRNYSWNRGKKNSLDAFAAGDTAMFIGFAKNLSLIKAKNPRLNFGVSPLPQAEGTEIKINYGRYDFLTVSRLSTKKPAAWLFLSYITSKEPNSDYLLKSNLPPARRDLITPEAKVPRELHIFYGQSLSAKAWLQPDETEIKIIFKDIIESLLSRRLSVNSVLVQANDRLNQLLKR